MASSVATQLSRLTGLTIFFLWVPVPVPVLELVPAPTPAAPASLPRLKHIMFCKNKFVVQCEAIFCVGVCAEYLSLLSQHWKDIQSRKSK
jgi:hypothetical protein